jgi:hypothetical protein
MMMRSDNPLFTDPALKIISGLDPTLRTRMSGTPWNVHVIETGKEQSIVDYHDSNGPWNAMRLLDGLNSAYGITPLHPDGAGMGLTFLNKPAIEKEARELKVPVAQFLAAILVHEFTHDEKGPDEQEAFAAGSAFARKMHSPEIYLLSEETRKEEAHAG